MRRIQFPFLSFKIKFFFSHERPIDLLHLSVIDFDEPAVFSGLVKQCSIPARLNLVYYLVDNRLIVLLIRLNSTLGISAHLPSLRRLTQFFSLWLKFIASKFGKDL